MSDTFDMGQLRSPKPLIPYLGLILLVLTAVVLTACGSPPTEARTIGARLDLAAGDVTVTEGTESDRAVSGTPLATDAKVATGKGARAFVRAQDGAGVFMRGETVLVLGERAMKLESGQVWIDAVRAERAAIPCQAGPHVVTASDAGIDVKLEGETITVYVARGLATLTSPGGHVEVNAGQQAVANKTDAPKISPVAFWEDWTGGMGDARSAHGGVGSGSGRIYGIDPFAAPGSPAFSLGISKQVVRVVIRDGVAETSVDQTFSNPGSRPTEGWYWFTVPTDAHVTSFALETKGQLIEGEMIEKREAVGRYGAAVNAGQDPALLEWVDGRSYRARIYPIPANGTRRVVLKYMQILPLVENKTRFIYPLRSDDPVRFDEFALTVDMGDEGPEMRIATSLDARIEEKGRRVSIRRSGYVPQADFQLQFEKKTPAQPLRAWRFAAGEDQADYVMVRYVPDLDFSRLSNVQGDVAVVVDTSAAGDESSRQLRKSMAEAILRALAPGDRFTLIAVDVGATVLYPEKGLAPASDEEIRRALAKLSGHTASGATDIASMFAPALSRLHGTEQPALVYVGDGASTSGESTPEELTDRLHRSLTGSRARLFCVGVGSDAQHRVMEHLARAGGGRYLRVDEADAATAQALRLASLIKTPTVTDLEIDLGAGLDQPFMSSSGRLSRGEELVLLARTHHPLPTGAMVRGRLAGEEFNRAYQVSTTTSVVTPLVPRFWAGEYARSLLGRGDSPDSERAKVLELGLNYGLMTPFTSILALDSEQAYIQQGIKRRRSPLHGVHLTSIQNPADEQRIVARYVPSVGVVAGCNGGEEADEAQPATEVQRVPKRSGDKSRGEGLSRQKPVGVAAAPVATATAAAPATASPMEEPGLHEKNSRGEEKNFARDESDLPVRLGAGKKDGDDRAAGKAGGRPRPAKPPAGRRPMDKEKAAESKREAVVVPRGPRTCSDGASRPLPERIVLWSKRLKHATDSRHLVQQYELARNACELPDWKDQTALLNLIEKRISTEQAVETVLAHFASEPAAQKYLAKQILRRTVDARMAAMVSRIVFGSAVDWQVIDRELLELATPQERLDHLRKAMLIAGDDPNGHARLVRLLAESGAVAEALSHGRRMRDRGFMTPVLAQQLGDVLATSGKREEALRTYSEVVEFDPHSPVSRRLLGDTFLRHGWYDAAYGQYKTLSGLEPKKPSNWLRLASAAGGAGRVDEALRIEREVARGEGRPGPSDPRLWARLRSAARLGLLLHDPAAAGGANAVSAVTRKLKDLQLFSGPSTLALLTWEDLDARLALSGQESGEEVVPSENTDAGETGLAELILADDAWERATWTVRSRTDPRGRVVKFTLVAINWNGTKFHVEVRNGSLAGDATQVALASK
jgi:Ca-activated chloride channel homolog